MLMPVCSAPSSRPSRTPPDRKPSGSASSYWNSGDAMLIRRIAELRLAVRIGSELEQQRRELRIVPDSGSAE